MMQKMSVMVEMEGETSRRCMTSLEHIKFQNSSIHVGRAFIELDTSAGSLQLQ